MEPILIPVIYQEDTNGLIRAVEESKKLRQETEKLKETQKEAYDESADSVNEYTKALNEAGAEQKKNEQAAKSLSRQILDGAKGYRVFGTSLNDIIGKLKAKQDALNGVIKGLRSGGAALQVFKAALVSTGIGAIVVVLGSLVAFLTKTQKGIEIVNKALAGFTATVNVVIDRAAQFGEVIFGIFDRPLLETLSLTKDAFSGIGDEIAREVDLAIQLEEQLQAIEKATILLNIQTAARRAEIKELNKIAEDTTKGERERINAAKEAIGIEQQLLNERLKNQKALIANQLGQTEFTRETEEQLRRIASGAVTADEVISGLGLSNSTIDDLKEFESIATDFFNTQAESLELQTTLNNKLNTITQEGANKRQQALEKERQRIEQLQGQYESLFNTLQERVQSAELDSLGIIERIDREEEIALEALDMFRKDLEEKARALKIDKDFSEDFERLAENIRRESEKARQAALDASRDIRNALERSINNALEGGSGNINIEPLASAFGDDAEKRVQEIVSGSISKGVSDGLKDAGQGDTFFEAISRFKDGLVDKLGLDGEQAKAIFGGFEQAFQNLFDSRQALLEAEINAQDRLLDALNERIDEQESALDRELELKKAGFANNFDAEKANLEALQLEREAAEAKRAELEEKARKRQAALDTAQQASSLITATANIFKGFSSIPLIGQILAAAAVAAMFASFAAAKVNARKAAKQEFGGGGALDDYFSGEAVGASHGAPGSGRGMKGRTKNGNEFLFEGREIIVNKRDAQEQKPFLLDVNAGKYRGYDLDGLMQQAKAMQNGSPLYTLPPMEVPDIFSRVPAIREATKEIVREKAVKQADMGKYFASLENRMMAVEKAIKEKKTITALPTGEIYEESQKGNVRTVKIKKVGRNG